MDALRADRHLQAELAELQKQDSILAEQAHREKQQLLRDREAAVAKHSKGEEPDRRLGVKAVERLMGVAKEQGERNALLTR